MRHRHHQRFAAFGIIPAVCAVLVLVAGGIHVHADDGAAHCLVCMAAFGTGALLPDLGPGVVFWVLMAVLPLLCPLTPRFASFSRLASRSPPA